MNVWMRMQSVMTPGVSVRIPILTKMEFVVNINYSLQIFELLIEYDEPQQIDNISLTMKFDCIDLIQLIFSSENTAGFPMRF